MELLPVTLPHVLELDNLQLHHRDPFDRLLIAQAKVERVAILSNDSVFAQYAVPTVW
jgi:PIN domain nuclease of toxin-antitoxin system